MGRPSPSPQGTRVCSPWFIFGSHFREQVGAGKSKTEKMLWAPGCPSCRDPLQTGGGPLRRETPRRESLPFVSCRHWPRLVPEHVNGLSFQGLHVFQNGCDVPCGGDRETQGRDKPGQTPSCHRGRVLPGCAWAQLGARAELRQEVGQEGWRWGPKHLTPGGDRSSSGVVQDRDSSTWHSAGYQPKGC